MGISTLGALTLGISTFGTEGIGAFGAGGMGDFGVFMAGILSRGDLGGVGISLITVLVGSTIEGTVAFSVNESTSFPVIGLKIIFWKREMT